MRAPLVLLGCSAVWLGLSRLNVVPATGWAVTVAEASRWVACGAGGFLAVLVPWRLLQRR